MEVYKSPSPVVVPVNRTKTVVLWQSLELTHVSTTVSPEFALKYLLNLTCLSHLTLLA